MAASQDIKFNHETTRDKLVIAINEIYNVDSKITSKKDKYSDGNIYCIDFVLKSCNENVKNIKVSQITSTLHPLAKFKNIFQCLIYLNDDNKDKIKKLWNNLDKMYIGKVLLSYSEFTDKKDYYHGLITVSISCELNKVLENIEYLIYNIMQLSIYEVEKPKSEKLLYSSKTTSKNVSNDFTFANVSSGTTKTLSANAASYSATPKNILSVTEIYVDTEQNEVATSNGKTLDYKKVIDLNKDEYVALLL